MQNQITTILGRKGTGKTTLAKEILKDERRVFILDMLGNYAEAEIVWGREACIDRMLEASRQKSFCLSLRVVEDWEMLDLLDMGWEIPDTLFVLEETSFICSPSHLPKQLAKLVRYGRHRAISQIYIGRRPSELHRDLTAQSDLIVTFQQKEDRDLAYLQAAGFDAETVRALPDFHCQAVGDTLPLPVIKRLWEPRKRAAQQTRLTLVEDPASDSVDEGGESPGTVDPSP